MSAHARRVRKVHLKAADSQLIRRGAILLEDALNTASFSVEDSGKLVIVRRLDVGVIHSRSSSASLALKIEERFRQSGATVVHGGEPDAHHYPAVYFGDVAEAYSCLAIELAQGRVPHGWFWPLAVPGFHPEMPRDEALRLIVHAIVQTDAGIAAGVELLRHLAERRVLDTVLAALRWQEGLSLLGAFGWSKPDTRSFMRRAAPGQDYRRLGAAWREILDSWCSCWGREDARSHWLAAVALAAEKPARLLDTRRLLRRAQRVIDSAVSFHRLEIQGECAEDADASRYEQTVDSRDQSLGAHREEECLDYREFGRRPPLSSAVEIDQQVPPEVPASTSCAGLFFLLPAMARLGIDGFLETQPELSELDVPRRVLRLLGRRLPVRQDDPAIAVLGDADDVGEERDYPFSLPASWLQDLCAPGPWSICRVESAGGARVLLDGSGRLVLALWRGRVPVRVRQLIGKASLSRGRNVPYLPDVDLLAASWLTALRRWCRRFVRIGLHDLVCRPGYILATPIRLDAYLDHSCVDIRIRKAGLDIDPGWIPWFGRVVSFHYVDRNELYGQSTTLPAL